MQIFKQQRLKIKNFDDYEANFADDQADYIFAAKTPGSWANNLKVCVIDDKSDQILTGITTDSREVTTFNTVASTNGVIGITTTIITGINTSFVARIALIVRSPKLGGQSIRT